MYQTVSRKLQIAY